MEKETRNDYLTRDKVLKLLTDDEVAHVTTAETKDHLADGDEFLDMEHLSLGVQRAPGAKVAMGLVLPRKAVHEKTWDKILHEITAARSVSPTPR